MSLSENVGHSGLKHNKLFYPNEKINSIKFQWYKFYSPRQKLLFQLLNTNIVGNIFSYLFILRVSIGNLACILSHSFFITSVYKNIDTFYFCPTNRLLSAGRNILLNVNRNLKSFVVGRL